MKRFSNSAKWVRTTVFSLISTVSTSMLFAGGVRIVNCDEPVQSVKRGICENHLSAEDFKALAPGVSWFYNWHYETKELPPQGVKMEFIPMCWGDSQDRLDGLDRYLSNHKPRVVLAINEANLKGQAFIPPEQAAALYLKIRAIADKHGIPVVGPNMALGSANNDSISADDPIENKKVTYTFMVPFLKAFMHYVGDDSKVGALAWHGYGASGEFNWAMNLLTKEFNKPAWVTEYAWWKAPNDAEELKFMMQSTDAMERSDNVPGYAWFKERVGGNKKISLFEKESGKLTPLGKAYVNMPVHEKDLYYRVPGKLSAGKYVAMKDMQIFPSSATDGFIDMAADKNDASIDYNLQFESTGPYTVKLRVSGADEVTVTKDGLALGRKAGKDWKTIETKLQLNKGTATLRLTCSEKGQRIESIEFVKP
ncbi:hypothetical protein BH10PLA1_BH10PLA1_16350 [soil metagenome]